MIKRFQWAIALAVLLAGSTLASEPGQPPLEERPQAYQIAFWLNQAALAYNDKDYADWARATEKLHGLRPYNQDFMTHLVKAYAKKGDNSRAFNMMLTMQQQGLTQDWDDIAETESLRQYNLYNHLNTLMKEAGQSFGSARTFSVLDSDIAMPEALAFDKASGRLFLGSARDGRILHTTDGKQWEEFSSPRKHGELMAVFDLDIDAERGHLWVATGAAPHFRGFRAADQGRTALLKFDLESGELLDVHRVVPDGNVRLLGSLAIAADGTVFAADTLVPTIFRLIPGERHPQRFFNHENFTSLRGLALSGDDERLYVADYELGVLIVDTREQGRAWKLAVPETLNEGGIDGLYWWDNHLITIQNGIAPQRILRLQLGDDGLGVTAVAPLVAALPEFDTPTFGTLVDNTLYFLAGSHWGHVDPRGRPRSGKLPQISLMTTDVDSAAVMVVGQEILEQLRRQAGQQ